jgi:hypothetical protein
VQEYDAWKQAVSRDRPKPLTTKKLKQATLAFGTPAPREAPAAAARPPDPGAANAGRERTAAGHGGLTSGGSKSGGRGEQPGARGAGRKGGEGRSVREGMSAAERSGEGGSCPSAGQRRSERVVASPGVAYTA